MAYVIVLIIQSLLSRLWSRQTKCDMSLKDPGVYFLSYIYRHNILESKIKAAAAQDMPQHVFSAEKGWGGSLLYESDRAEQGCLLSRASVEI